ncbi:hypothetical protein KXX23_008941, partial [Aspergillus fumigatus]
MAGTANFSVDGSPLTVKITWVIIREEGDWKIVSHHVSSKAPLIDQANGVAEQGETPGGRRGYAGTWPPRAATAAQTGGYAPADFRAWSSLVEKLRGWARAEAGAGRLLPWVPVAFGTGIACYFAADHEPLLSAAALVAIALC